MISDEDLADIACDAGDLIASIENIGGVYSPSYVWAQEVVKLCAAVRIYKSKLQEVRALADDWRHTGTGWEIYDQGFCDAKHEAADQVMAMIGELE